MTDQEMLFLCLEAFKAIPMAQTSKRFLKKMEVTHVPYSGAATYRLARAMHDMLIKHLKIEDAA